MTKNLTTKQIKLIQSGAADEMCACGHPKSLHNDTISEGHGNCKICKIRKCPKFTFVDFIVE